MLDLLLSTQHGDGHEKGKKPAKKTIIKLPEKSGSPYQSFKALVLAGVSARWKGDGRPGGLSLDSVSSVVGRFSLSPPLIS